MWVPATARRALDALVAGGAGHQLAHWPDARERLPAAARARADAVVDALRETRAQPSAGARAERLRDALAPLIEARYPDGALRLHDLEQLVGAARESGAELRHFVGELVLDPPRSSGDLAGPPHLDEDYLVLSTVHSAKGLEWQAVHVLALYDGNFPADMAAGSEQSIDEERRLLYVALTRARRQLRLYVPVRYYHRPAGRDDAHGYGKPSRFLTGEVQGLCEVVRPVEEQGRLSGPGSGPRRITVSVDALFE